MTTPRTPEPVREERVSDATLNAFLGCGPMTGETLSIWHGDAFIYMPVRAVARDLRDARAALQARDERIQELMWALDKYGKHPDDCGDNQGSCNCGLRDAYEGRALLRPLGEGELGPVFARVSELERERVDIGTEFNAGYECAEKGGAPSDEPNEINHDEWLVGFAWFHWTNGDGKYTGRNNWPPIFAERDAAKAQVVRLREALESRATRVICGRCGSRYVKCAGCGEAGHTHSLIGSGEKDDPCRDEPIVHHRNCVLASTSEAAESFLAQVRLEPRACDCGQPAEPSCCDVGCGICPACTEHNRRIQVRASLVATGGEGKP